ncbi:MAG: hypothetical protein QOH81_1686 [Sphingomonadales bacterium]|jgi:hypothetical protein|nr:hypothetical protein [Sphingomonadales bacterium]
MTAFFKDQARQEEFDRRGFTVVRLLDRDEADQVRRQLDDARPRVSASPSACAYEQSFCTSDGDYRHRAHEIVSAAIGDRLMSLFNGYRLVACGVINKSPGKGMLPVHRDPDVLADQRLAAISAWCPLIDVDEASGNLMMLPGSHKLPNIEAAGLPRFYAGYEEALKPLCVSVPLTAGDAILFNQRLFHGSAPNRSNRDRPALRATAIPSESRMILHRLDGSSEGTRFELVKVEADSDGALAYNPEDLARPGFVAPVLGYAPNSNRPVPLSECKARVAEAEGRSGPGVLRLGLSNAALLRQRLRHLVRPRPAI